MTTQAKIKLGLQISVLVVEAVIGGIDNPQASGTSEMITTKDYSINIPQSRYEDLLKYQWKYEEGMMDAEGWEITIDGANEKLEQAYSALDEANARIAELEEQLAKAGEPVVIHEDAKPRKTIGGSLISDIDGGIGGGVELGLQWKRIEPFVGIDYYDDRLLFRGGMKYRIK